MRDFLFSSTDQPTLAEFNRRFGSLADFVNNVGNEYVWAKLGKTVSLGSAQSDKAIYIYKTLYYSDSITDSGELVNPQSNGAFSIMTQEAVMAELKSLSGKYFYFTGSATTTLATLIPDDTVFYMESCNPAVVANSDNSLYTGAVYRSVSVIEDTIYVNSPYADTYPPDVNDGYAYTALGKLGSKLRIATGSYKGTGKYGSSNPNSLTFDFVPKIVIIREVNNGRMAIMPTHGWSSSYTAKAYQVMGHTTANLSPAYNMGKISGKTISWYWNSTGSQSLDQLNESGATYYYTAIG